MSFFYVPNGEYKLHVPEICDVCNESEDTHSTPFYCDQTPPGARLASWFEKVDEILEEDDD